MGKTDRIEREVLVKAPRERVWSAITAPEELTAWFGDTAEVDLRPGGEASFGWSGYGHSFRAVVETVEAPHRFSYRWASKSDTPLAAGPSTLVEFTLEEADEGTRVFVVESGFTSFPEEEYEQAIGGNETGWDAELADLVEYVSAREVV